MQRNVVLKLVLSVFLGSLVAGGAPARGLSTQASITIVPAAPAVGDIVHVVVEGVAGGCGVGFVGLDVTPLLYVVRLAEGAPPGFSCPAAELPFTVEATLGRVPAGSHEVRVESHDLSDPDNVQHVGTRSFTVAGEPRSDLVLHDGRFHVEVSWEDFDNHEGVGRVVPGASEASGLFWFFGPGNWEVLVKVLDGCAVNGTCAVRPAFGPFWMPRRVSKWPTA